MLNKIFILSVLPFIFHVVNAQTQHTSLYYMNNYGQVVSDKNMADYLLYIMPKDSATQLYPILAEYPDGKRLLVGTSLNPDYNALMLDGPVINFYPNGRRKSIGNYSKGVLTGNLTDYYPNGKIYTIELIGEQHEYLVECCDSTGTVLAKNGNGKWIIFDPGFKHLLKQGPVADSLENGEWAEIINDTAKYTTVYKNGLVLSSTDPYTVTGEKVFTAVDHEPYFDGFGKFLEKNIRYPDEDKWRNIQGKVYLQFVVEKDGTLSNFRVLRSPDKTLADEAIRVLKLCPPWVPAMKNGRPVRTLYTIPIAFSIG